MLSAAQTAAFRDQGFLALPGFRSAADIAALRARAAEIVAAFDPDQAGIFTTSDQARHVDRWFLDSGDKIRCFLEAEARGADGRLRQAKALSVNKIGHALHDLDPVFARFSRGEPLASTAAALGLARPLIWQSMYIFKQPGIGGEVRWHQDASFFVTDPITVTTFWFALEDATPDNGCLWVEPGGHHGPLRERFVRHGDITALEQLDPTPWPDAASATPLPVEAGTLLVFHGKLPHYSAPNRSAVSRHAYTLHATDAASRYAETNWLQRGPALPARGFIAAA